MKKIIIKLLMTVLVTIGILSANTYALTMQDLTMNLDKTTVHPGENVTVKVDFGQFLGSYTFDFAYDNKLLEFVSASDGAPNDNGTRVRVVFPNGGTTPGEFLNVVFKAKEGITTSNPTEINITAEGLANADASERYENITTPITKQLMVEPIYEDYKINLSYAGNVEENKAKDMTLTISSAMGKSYEHVRLLAEATTPDGANVKLIGKETNGTEQDIIQSGWGADAGYSIGGKDAKQELKLTGTFNKAGEYSINVKLVDRDDSDNIIVEKAFAISVVEAPAVVPPESEQPTNPEKPTETPKPEPEPTPEEMPKTLPKTGSNLYVMAISTIAILSVAYVYISKKK